MIWHSIGLAKKLIQVFCMILGKPKLTFWPTKYNGTCLLSLCGPFFPSYGGECTEIRNARSWFTGCSQSNWGDETNTQAAMCYLNSVNLQSSGISWALSAIHRWPKGTDACWQKVSLHPSIWLERKKGHACYETISASIRLPHKASVLTFHHIFHVKTQR